MSDTGQNLPVNETGLSNYDPVVPGVWHDALSNYGTLGNIRLCPSTLTIQVAGVDQIIVGTANLSWSAWDVNTLSSASGSYGMNGYLCEPITPYPKLPGLKLQYIFPKPSSVQKPSQTPFFFDEIYLDTFPLETDAGAPDLYLGEVPSGTVGGGRGMACCTILRHGGPTATSSYPYPPKKPLPGAINMSFDDGHAQLVPLQSLWSYYWHLNWNPATAHPP